MRRPAYTIIELAVVLVVIGILATIAGVAISNALRSIQLNGAADKVASDLHFAQSMASSNGRWYGVRFKALGQAAADEVAGHFHLPFIESPAYAATVATPTMSPAGGTYSTDQSVAISCSTYNATIRYTTDGSTPTTSSPAYSSPIAVSGNGTTMTIRAMATRSGYTNSAIDTENYTITYPATTTTATTTTTGSTTTIITPTTTTTTLLRGNNYSVFTFTGTAETAIPDPGNANQSLTVNLNTTYPGVTITAVNIAGGNTVVFNPVGTPYNAQYGAALSSEGVVTLSNGSNTVTVRIAPDTGRIFVQ